MRTVLYGRGYKGPENVITTTPPALAVNTYPAEAKSFELQGKSLVLNQWAKELLGENVRSYGVEVTTEDGVITAIYAVQQYGFCGLKVSLTAGHKFFLYGEVNTNNKSNVRVILSDNNAGLFTFSQNLSATNDWQVVSTIVTVSNASDAKVFGVQDLKSSGWDDINVRKFMLIDLTQMFGAGLEPTTVDQLKSIIDLDKYIPYNPGMLIHANNEWDVNRWNQNAGTVSIASDTKGLTITHNNDGTFTVSGKPTSEGIVVLQSGGKYIEGHKYLLYGLPSGLSDIKLNRYIGVQLFDAGAGGIATATESGGAGDYIRLIIYSTASTYNFTFSVKFIDLTDIFGAGKEPTSVNVVKIYFKGFGIDLDTYQPYFPLGSNLGGKVDLGFNIWDEQVRLGRYDGSTGEYDSSYTDRLCDINPTPCMPNTTYYFKTKSGITAGTVQFYDNQMNFLSRVTNSGNTTFTTPNNACYLHFSFGNAYGTTYNHDICINLSQPNTSMSPHNGNYRPYLMLRGIGSDFNVWDEQWELGRFSSTDGTKVASSTQIRSKNFIKCLPGITYYFRGTSSYFNVFYYDMNHNFLSYSPQNVNAIFTIPNNAYYMRFALLDAYGTIYKNDICINLSQPQITINPHNGQYVPHLFDTYDSMSGILTRRIGVVDLGTLTWTYSSGYGGFYATVTNVNFTNPYDKAPSILCSKYAVFAYSAYLGGLSSSFITAWVGLGSDKVFVKDNDYGTDVATFKAAMSGVMLLYELATPTIETAIIQPISFVSGKLGKQYGVVDLGSLGWTYQSTYNYFYLSFSSAKTPTVNLVCAKYKTVDGTVLTNITTNDKVVAIRSGNLVIKDSLYTDTTAFKNSLHGQYLIYELSDSATNPTYATAGNLIQKTKGDVGDVDFNLLYDTQLNSNKFLISYNVGTQQSPNKKLIDVGGLL